VGAPPQETPANGAIVLKINKLRVSPLFAGRAMVYRVADLQYESDFYDEWFVAPGTLVTQQVHQWLSRSAGFETVVVGTNHVEPTHLLEGTVTEFYGDFRAAPGRCSVSSCICSTRSMNDSSSGARTIRMCRSAISRPKRWPVGSPRRYGPSSSTLSRILRQSNSFEHRDHPVHDAVLLVLIIWRCLVIPLDDALSSTHTPSSSQRRRAYSISSIVMALVLTACHTLPAKYVEQAERGVTLTSLTGSPQLYRDKVVILGGVLVKEREEGSQVWLHLKNRPLDPKYHPHRPVSLDGPKRDTSG
jgi:hypothetical protein